MSQSLATEKQRRDELEVVIGVYAKKGYRVINRTDYTAQMVKPKTFSAFAAILRLLFFVVGLFIYLLMYLADRDATMYVSIDEFANPHITHTKG